ncbi:hypothetical protein COO59_12125 [Mixta theicola]|uniref:Uncharacterized protein n=1 Tax=Mixta theicola TaxID=1458355 RepID=A0A2K1Q8L1_9GAMM|nr:hypothetical protein COO59_12125 [Mixta theicola]
MLLINKLIIILIFPYRLTPLNDLIKTNLFCNLKPYVITFLLQVRLKIAAIRLVCNDFYRNGKVEQNTAIADQAFNCNTLLKNSKTS